MFLLIDLGHDGPGRFEHSEEYEALMAEFEAWEPESATANGQSARYWMNLAQQYAEECITLRHKVRR